jgi:hypothetical protein
MIGRRQSIPEMPIHPAARGLMISLALAGGSRDANHPTHRLWYEDSNERAYSAYTPYHRIQGNPGLVDSGLQTLYRERSKSMSG